MRHCRWRNTTNERTNDPSHRIASHRIVSIASSRSLRIFNDTQRECGTHIRRLLKLSRFLKLVFSKKKKKIQHRERERERNCKLEVERQHSGRYTYRLTETQRQLDVIQKKTQSQCRSNGALAFHAE